MGLRVPAQTHLLPRSGGSGAPLENSQTRVSSSRHEKVVGALDIRRRAPSEARRGLHVESGLGWWLPTGTSVCTADKGPGPSWWCVRRTSISAVSC